MMDVSLHLPLFLLWSTITLEQGQSGLIRPHDLFPLLQSPIFMLPSKLKPFFLIGFAEKCFSFSTALSTNSLSSLHIMQVEMLLLSLLNIAMSAVDYLPLDFSKRLPDLLSRSFKIFFQPHFFLEGDGSPLSFQVLIMSGQFLTQF